MRVPTTAFTNLASGLRLLAFLPVTRQSFQPSLQQVVLFGALAGAIWYAFDHFTVGGPNPQFVWASVAQVCWLALVFAGALLFVLPAGRDCVNGALVLTAAASALPGYILLMLALVFFSSHTSLGHWVGYGIALLASVYLYRILRLVDGSGALASVAVALLVCGITWATFDKTVGTRPQLWKLRDDATAESVDSETLMFRQASLIDAAVSELAPQTSGKTDVYFIGFAGDGRESVFGTEVAFAQQVLARKLDIERRTLELVNTPVASATTPIATETGLRFALKRIAAVMDVDNDVLVLFLTSHGTRQGTLVINRRGWPLRDLSAEALGTALREAGIKWRIVIVSACYSGSFIDALRDANTMVITAARADRKSFGCRSDRELTYFGEALFRDALPQSRSLLEALSRADALVSERERAEKILPSEPQNYIGARMQGKLDEIPFRTPAANLLTAD